MTSVAPHDQKTPTAAERAFLEQPYVGIATTLRKDVSPHSSPVWVDVDDDGVSINTAWPRAKPKQIARDPRVSVIVMDPANMYRWVAVSGTGSLAEEGSNEQIDRLAKKYTGAERYPGHRDGETRVSVRISPTKIESRGLS